jgi:hypothetical protein
VARAVAYVRDTIKVGVQLSLITQPLGRSFDPTLCRRTIRARIWTACTLGEPPLRSLRLAMPASLTCLCLYLFLSGHSAGAHLAALLTLDRKVRISTELPAPRCVTVQAQLGWLCCARTVSDGGGRAFLVHQGRRGGLWSLHSGLPALDQRKRHPGIHISIGVSTVLPGCSAAFDLIWLLCLLASPENCSHSLPRCGSFLRLLVDFGSALSDLCCVCVVRTEQGLPRRVHALRVWRR